MNGPTESESPAREELEKRLLRLQLERRVVLQRQADQRANPRQGSSLWQKNRQEMLSFELSRVN